jgi:hypothetical protein
MALSTDDYVAVCLDRDLIRRAKERINHVDVWDLSDFVEQAVVEKLARDAEPANLKKLSPGAEQAPRPENDSPSTAGGLA